MKRFLKSLACLLILCVTLGCFTQSPAECEISTEQLEQSITEELATFLGEDYNVDVETYYVSKEYLEELQFNSRKTRWFGYYLDDILAQMQDEKWVFTVGEDGQTTVQAYGPYDDTYDVALRKLAVGTGVILICVTISAVSGGLGAPAVSAIFAASAKGATIMGLTSGTICGVFSGVKTAVETDGDIEASMKAFASSGSNAFMWGTISGAVAGGAKEAFTLYRGTTNGLTMNQVVDVRNQSGWDTGVISHIKSMDEYNLYKQEGLEFLSVNNHSYLIPSNLDLNYQVNTAGTMLTNYERMSRGFPAINPLTGEAYQMHHVNQEINGIIAILTKETHLGNAGILNTPGKDGVQAALGSTWGTIRMKNWKELAECLGGV